MDAEMSDEALILILTQHISFKPMAHGGFSISCKVFDICK